MNNTNNSTPLRGSTERAEGKPDIKMFMQQNNIFKKQHLNPRYVPCVKNTKIPLLGTKISDNTTSLTVKEAIKYMTQGCNIAIVTHPTRNYGIWDHDNISKFLWNKKTFTIQTPSGGLHKYFIHNEFEHGRNLSGLGEIKIYNTYCLTAGSIKDGKYYTIIDTSPLTALTIEELPQEWKPRTYTPSNACAGQAVGFIQTQSIDFDLSSCVNSKGEDFFTCMERCPSILERLEVPVDGAFRGVEIDDSKHDFTIMAWLHKQGFSDEDIFDILTTYRDRPKLHNNYYFSQSLQKAKNSLWVTQCSKTMFFF